MRRGRSVVRWAGPGKGGAGTGGRDLAEVRLVGTAQGARRFGAERQGVFSREFEGNAVFFPPRGVLGCWRQRPERGESGPRGE